MFVIKFVRFPKGLPQGCAALNGAVRLVELVYFHDSWAPKILNNLPHVTTVDLHTAVSAT